MKNTLLSLAVLLALTVPARGEVIQGQLTGPFGNTIDTRTEGTFLLHRANAGTVTFTVTDDNANATLSVQPGGTGGLTLGDSDSTVTISGSGGLTLANGESLNTDTDDVFDFTRDDAGTVTLTASDNDATAALTLDPGGAAALTLGSADVTSITAIVDTDFTLRNGATGSVTFDFRDYADTTDDDMAHVIQTVNCTDAGTGAEDCDWTLGVVEAGAAAETRLAVDADGDITVGSANNANNISLSTGLQLRNSATGNVDIDFRDYADSADDDMAHVLLRANCTDATTGAEDCDFSVGVAEAGAAAETRLAIDADGDITIGSANNGGIVGLSTGTSLRNSATGNVDLDFRDYADSADDDMAHALVRVNCTDATTGAEDCDLTVGVVEAGAAAETRLNIDADAGVTIGSTNTDSFTVTTDGTGTGEVVLPLQSIAAGEIVNDTIDGTELADTLTLDAAFIVTGAQSINLGNNLATTVTVDTDGTGDAEFVVPDSSIAALEITDVTRSVPLPLGAWVPCTGTTAGLWDGAGGDNEPDMAAVNTALVIEYDAAGGGFDDTEEVCTSFTVPADYASGGTLVFRLTQGAATVTQIESVECRISVDGGAIGAADEDNLVNQTAVQTITSAPTGTWAAGASIGVACKQGNADPDDTVNFHSGEGRYTATQ